jgi:hypothetical protein
MASNQIRSGGCLCGAVRFEIPVPEATFTVCHCGMCRRWSAGPFMAVHCPGPANFTKDSGLTWYRGSKWGERGFCGRCGSSLFWRLANDPTAMLGVSAEAFDDADDLSLDRHIYTDAKPARYAFADDRPRLTEAQFLAELGVTPAADA